MAGRLDRFNQKSFINLPGSGVEDIQCASLTDKLRAASQTAISKYGNSPAGRRSGRQNGICFPIANNLVGNIGVS